MMITSPGFLQHWRYWGWHLLPVQESFALLQIVLRGAVNLTPLLRVIWMSKRPLLFLLRGLLTTVSPVICVDLTIILLS
jgi:hypothetical protein